MPNPLVGYGKVYNSYVRERGKVRLCGMGTLMSSMEGLSVSQSTTSLSVISIICRVLCVVSSFGQ